MRVLGASKKHALSRGSLGCLGEVATLNVTRGCGAECAFCYARCYPGAPEPGTLLVYRDLPALLRQELDTPRRKRPLPRFVILGTASDPFIGGPQVTAVTRSCLEILFARGIGVSLSTRAAILPEIVELLGRYADLVQVAIPVPSLADDYVRTWEPGSALPAERLFAIQRLRAAGVHVAARIDPVIPFVNDGSEELRAVISALVGLGFATVFASFLHLRPGVAPQIEQAIAPATRRLVLGSFAGLRSGRPRRFEHIPHDQAMAALERLQRIAEEHGLELRACRCQNPGLPGASCPLIPPDLPDALPGTQGDLFGPSEPDEEHADDRDPAPG